VSGALTKEQKPFEGRGERKVDVKKLVAVIPPPSMLFGARGRRQREKRIRLRYAEDVKREEARVPKRLAEELGIRDALEITVAGKKRFRFKAVIDERLGGDYVYVNPELMRENGIADNSICTIRAARAG